jgi:hypothetical protein
MERRERRGSLIGPLILIGLGLIFLLNNLGIVGWDVWDIVVRFWPILLIAIGLDILIGRRSVLGSLLALAVTVAVIGAGLWLISSQIAPGPVLTYESIDQPLEGATLGDVTIGFGSGALRLGVSPEGSSLIAGKVALGQGERLVRDFHKSGDTAAFTLRSEGFAMGPFVGRGNADKVWDLRLSPEVPLRLNVNTGVGESTLDMERLKLTELDLHAGIGKVTLTLPAHGQVQASVNGGIGEVVVRIPAGVAAHVHATAGLGNSQVMGNYQRQDGVYVSPGYDTAENRVDLEVKGGIGKITVQQYQGE